MTEHVQPPDIDPVAEAVYVAIRDRFPRAHEESCDQLAGAIVYRTLSVSHVVGDLWMAYVGIDDTYFLDPVSSVADQVYDTIREWFSHRKAADRRELALHIVFDVLQLRHFVGEIWTLNAPAPGSGSSNRAVREAVTERRPQLSRDPVIRRRKSKRCGILGRGHNVNHIPAIKSHNVLHHQGRLVDVQGDVVAIEYPNGRIDRFRNHDVGRLVDIIRLGGVVKLPEGFYPWLIKSIDGNCFSLLPISEEWRPCQ
jgi:hypothetical protein